MRVCVEREEKVRIVGAGKWLKTGESVPINW